MQPLSKYMPRLQLKVNGNSRQGTNANFKYFQINYRVLTVSNDDIL